MKRKSLLILTLTLATIGAASAWYFTSGKYPVEKNVHVLCKNMMYACGDCYPQYNVKLIMPESLGKELSGKDIDIEFADSRKEQELEKKMGVCAICYEYDFSGDLYYSLRKSCYVLKVSRYRIKEGFEGCCSH